MLKTIIILILIVAILYACTHTSGYKHNQSVHAYFDALSRIDKTAKADAKQQLKLVFGDMSQGATEQIIREVYAEQLYFNDTFKVITNREELISYLMKTAEAAETQVKILDVVKSDCDYYVRWRMKFDFSALGKDIQSDSVGITQLRFNQQGQITFHHDFWNSTEGFYEHLPGIGRFLIKIKHSL